jgi:lipopolysaccharide/colanic/teichoic acid biosynthesis glycosyltransferase/glycosyltransferase involved in cell wall biosynthesis
VASVPEFFGFLHGQIPFMQQRGFEVLGVCSPERMVAELARRENIAIYTIPIRRPPAPLSDLRSLWQLVRLFRRLKPTLVHLHTPKAGLLGAIGALIAGVPARIYQMHGLRMMTTKGLKHRILKLCERIACTSVDRVLSDSHSVRSVVISQRVCKEAKVKVLCSGSANGVDTRVFSRPSKVVELGSTMRAALKIPTDSLVLGFVGRVVRDKGIAELVGAWNALRSEFPHLYLLLIGPIERDNPISSNELSCFREDDRIRLVGWVNGDKLPGYYAAMNVVAFPSYREGFGNVCIEASAMELPVVATRVPGCVDAVHDGVTGILVPPGDAVALADAIRKLLKDPELRQRMGKAGRERVLRDFRPEPIWEALYQEYMELLSKRTARSCQERLVGAGLRKAQALTKRVFDAVGAALGLGALSPLLAVIALLTRLTMGRPVLYVGPRPGLGGQIFKLYKFRTMTEERGTDGRLLPDANRLTSLGRFLRRLSLDELPQLWNVVKGDMSLVGPRPLLVEYLDRYTPMQARRHEVRPGITGWAQVNGRNALTWEQKFELDVWYVDHRSWWLDVKILSKTLEMVLKREGIWMRGEMNEPFMGTLPGATPKQSEQVDKVFRRDNSRLSGLRASEQTCRSY